MSDFQTKAKSSALWLLFGNSLNRILGVISMVVVARILSPEDFGIISLATAVWGLFTTVFSVGIEASVIHHQKHDADFLDTAFWMNQGVAIVLILITLALTPIIEKYFQMPGLTAVVMVYAGAFVFQGLMQIHNAIINRELAFKTSSVFNFLFQLFDAVTTIIMAVMGAGYWSLVLPKLILAPLKTIIWWKYCNWRPRLVFSLDHARDIFRFSIQYLGATLMIYININSDYLIVGKALGQARLGMYQLAYNSAQWPITNFIFQINSLVFPYFARLRDDNEKFNEHYLKMIRVISLLAFPLFIGAALLAPEGIPLIFGEKWEPIIFPFQMLCLFGVFRSVGSPGGPVMLALGRPDLLFRFTLCQAPVLVGAILFAVRYDISGVSLASLLVLGGGGIIFMALTMRLLGIRFSSFLKAVLPAFCCSLFMAGLLIWFNHYYFFHWKSVPFYLAAAVLAGSTVYFISLGVGFRETLSQGWNFISSSMKGFIDSRQDKLSVL